MLLAVVIILLTVNVGTEPAGEIAWIDLLLQKETRRDRQPWA